MDKLKLTHFLISFIVVLLLLVGAHTFLISDTGRVLVAKFIKDPPVDELERPLPPKPTAVEQEPKISENCEAAQGIGYSYYVDSVWNKNNKFGIYIYAENRDFFEAAQNLVNSSGGDWGYVLIPYNVKDRDFSKWFRVFDQLRNKHLIPIIQLWDVDTDKYEEQTREAADFLNRFVWPIRQRYISAYNEMNDSRFWYGRIDPAEYARILNFTIDAFNEENDNFYMLNGAFNISAPTDGKHMDAFEYMSKMNDEVPGVFNKLDGWASHSYPQPNFSGGPYSTGRWSIKAYEDELSFIYNNLGVEKELPVFITETGWAHAEGAVYNSTFLNTKTIAEYVRIAFEEVWLKDDRVRAVTPFTIRYDPPHDHFSWLNKDNVPYEHFDVVKSIEKLNGNPPYIQAENIDLSACE